MARSLKEGLTAVLSGGSVYWMVILKANQGDIDTEAWGAGITQIAAANITTTSFGADTTVWTGKLLDISDIDVTADIFNSPLSKIGDVDITIKNTDAALTPNDYIGRGCEIRLGYGTTASVATSDIFFTGKIIEATSSKKDINFLVRGKSQLRDKEIGKRVPDTANEKYRGKIYPISHGAWTDDDAYLPLIIEDESTAFQQIVFDENSWKDFDSLYLYDEESQKSYRVNDTTQFRVSSNNNALYFNTIIDTTLNGEVSEVGEYIRVHDYTKITYYTSSGTDLPAPSIIQIDDEIMLLLATPYTDGYVLVERGYAGTAKSIHANGSIIYQYTENASNLYIMINATFYPVNFSGFNTTVSDSSLSSVFRMREVTTIEGLLNRTDYRKHNFFIGYSDVSGNTRIWYDMVFEKIGISGTVIKQYVLCDGDISITITSTVGGSVACRIQLIKEGDYTDGKKDILIKGSSGTGTFTGSFNNFPGGADAEKDIDMTSLAITNISDLNNTRFSLGWYLINSFSGDSYNYGTGYIEVKGIGFRCDIKVNPIEFDFYARAETRKNPGDYFNGDAGDLIENPSSVLEDVCRNDVDGVSSSDLNETAFDAFYTARADWKLASCIHSDMELKI